MDGIDWHALNIWIHVVSGGVALGVGLVPLLTEKGSGPHRAFGQAFAGIAAATFLTAMIGNIFFNPPPALMAATLAAGYQYLSGLRALSLRETGPRPVDALFALAALGGCGWLYIAMTSGTMSWPPAFGYATIGAVGSVALYDLSRHLWRPTWLAHARDLDHGLKMTSAYFGMAAAGAGNVLRDFQPFSQFGPNLLGIVVILFFVLRRTAWRRSE